MMAIGGVERDLDYYVEQLDRAVVGHAAAKRELAPLLRSFVMRAKQPVTHVLLLGPPGCGKGTLGRALCAAVSPLPQAVIEHVDELNELLTREAPPKHALIFIRNIDNLVMKGEAFEAWLEAMRKVHTTVLASATSTPANIGLRLVFENTIELDALTPREVESVLVHPRSALMEEVATRARKGVTLVMLPEAKRVLRDTAIGSGRGLNVMRDFIRGLAKTIPPDTRGDFMMDRETVETALKNVGLSA